MRKKDVLPHLNPLLARRGIVWIICCLFSFNAHATCTPAPDCASIGYTETSCETISLKCPFDQTKLYCFPCDSSYQYSCSNPNEYGDGESCKGKYKSCCNTSCSVGNIYYSDGTCSSCVDTTKTAVGVVMKNKENELIISSVNLVRSNWAPSVTNITSLTAFDDANDAKNDYNGVSNTQIIVDYFGTSVTGVAGVYCYNYAPEVWENTKGMWYLPAVGELYFYLYENIDIIENIWSKLSINLGTSFFWTSTRKDSTNVWAVNIDTGALHYGQIDNCSVLCFFKVQ